MWGVEGFCLPTLSFSLSPQEPGFHKVLQEPEAPPAPRSWGSVGSGFLGF